MSDKLREFFKKNEARIGDKKDFRTNPPVYYTSLNDAFRNYFLTARDRMDTIHFISYPINWSHEELAFHFTSSTEYITFSILGFHRFIELLLKDILRRINPFLAVKFIEKEDELFNYFENNIAADDIKTIEYGEAIKRFKQAFTHYGKTTQVYKQNLECYEFLRNSRNEETLKYLAEWRNRIMHNGTTFPNVFAYEYFISQRIIPLIDEIIKAEKKYLKDYLPHFFETMTGVNIIENILSIKFEFPDFENKNKLSEITNKLFNLIHLKELGRAAFNIDVYLKENHSFYEPLYKNPIARAEKFAAIEKAHPNFRDLTNCICCGTKSLVIYRVSLPNNTFSSWAKCFNCDYIIKHNIGDPYLFKLSKKRIFPTE